MDTTMVREGSKEKKSKKRERSTKELEPELTADRLWLPHGL